MMGFCYVQTFMNVHQIPANMVVYALMKSMVLNVIVSQDTLVASAKLVSMSTLPEYDLNMVR